ncbi:phosphopantetheine-binding protein [Nonomuraea sp. NPDC050663]|uniref:phosphopantetheine-binding protein n=1 Tax=Nonomuraea sp. NPDC050663 TaxID=3364370 RepID=UPI00179DA058|nr:acyl carrier protein [Thermoactinospora sp.]
MTAREKVWSAVREGITDILPGARIEGDLHLRDLGADSVDRVEIILGVLDRLGVQEPLSSFSEIPNIDALVDFLEERVR